MGTSLEEGIFVLIVTCGHAYYLCAAHTCIGVQDGYRVRCYRGRCGSLCYRRRFGRKHDYILDISQSGDEEFLHHWICMCARQPCLCCAMTMHCDCTHKPHKHTSLSYSRRYRC